MSYVNARTGKPYSPHHDAEAALMADDTTRRIAVLGGEGSGKSTFGVIKTLERLRRGCVGVAGSPDLPHFKKSLWPEFRDWCPWDFVVPEQRFRRADRWKPSEAFEMNFVNGARLMMGGFEEPMSWEGPNMNFFYFDECRRHREPEMLKVIEGRIRLDQRFDGALIPPQAIFTSTPRKHWMYEYFGPLEVKEGKTVDKLAAYKARLKVLQLRTVDNSSNLTADYAQVRGEGLLEWERRVVLEGEWEDEVDTEQYIHPEHWAACADPTLTGTITEGRTGTGCRWVRWVDNSLTANQMIAFAADGSLRDDTTAIVGVSEHPRQRGVYAVRYVLVFYPEADRPIDFEQLEDDLAKVWRAYACLSIAYDETQLANLAQRLARKGVRAEVFSQGAPRLEADTSLRSMVMSRQIRHGGFAGLTEQILNANAKAQTTDDKDSRSKRVRIVKRRGDLKIDACVTVSMALQHFRSNVR
jgi:hypothetical protein